MIKLQKDISISYQLSTDTENPTIFKLQPLRGLSSLKKIGTINFLINSDDSTQYCQKNLYEDQLFTLTTCIIGWENLTMEEKEIPFNRVNLAEVLNVLDKTALDELYSKIMEISGYSNETSKEITKKKSKH